LVLVLFLIFGNYIPFLVNAQEENVVETPVPVETVVDCENSAEIENNTESVADSGNNEIVTPIPTSTSNPVLSSESESLESEQENLSFTSTFEQDVLSSTPSPEDNTEIITEDAVSVVEVGNDVNSNIVNSVFVNHTLNIFLQDGVGDIDLSLLSEKAVDLVFNTDQKLDPVVDILITTEGNFVYLENNIESLAVTGENSISGGGNSKITTGDAYSIVSVINNVNTNIVDSEFHLVTVNIFGNLEGNIILPDEKNDNSGSLVVNNSLNNALVENNVISESISGQNTIVTSSKDGSKITTGNSVSSINIVNVVNTDWVDTVFMDLVINPYGSWDGNFLGWGEEFSPEENDSEIISDNSNSAEIVNNIYSKADSGQNLINSETAEIKSGNAYSSVTLFNLINSNIVRSFGFFGFINIFGTLKGDIGGADFFVDPEANDLNKEENQNNTNDVSQDENSGFQKESGGKLIFHAKHNVGEYVLPGDTITFDVSLNNTGTGKVYDTTVYIELFKNGENLGGSFYNLGEIKASEGFGLSTGLVLSEEAIGGDYEALVTAVANTADGELSESTNLPFKIKSFGRLVEDSLVSGVSATDDLPPQVLGTNASGFSEVEKKMVYMFLSLLGIYLLGKGYQKREILVFPAFRKIEDYALRIGSLLT